MSDEKDGNAEVKLLAEIRDLEQESLDVSRQILRLYRRDMKLLLWGLILFILLAAGILIWIGIDAHLLIKEEREQQRQREGERERFRRDLEGVRVRPKTVPWQAFVNYRSVQSL